MRLGLFPGNDLPLMRGCATKSRQKRDANAGKWVAAPFVYEWFAVSKRRRSRIKPLSQIDW